MADISQAVEQADIADSILDAPIVGSWADGALAEEGEGGEHDPETWTDPGQEILSEFEQQRPQQEGQEQGRHQSQSQNETQTPAEPTPQQVQEGVEGLSQAVEQYQLNDSSAAQQLAYDLTAPFGGDPGSVDAKALGGTMAKAVLSAAQIFDSVGGKLENLAPVPREAAQQFTSDFLRSFGLDPRTAQVDPQRFSQLILGGTLSFISAAKTYGLNATMDRLNSPEAAEGFAKELHQCFGDDRAVSREYALHLADAGGKYILGILQKLQQLQPAQHPARRSASASPRQARGGKRSSAQFQTNGDIFDDDTMNLYQREHGRL
ncbi:MAG TPA: hypothetical protein VJ999_11440 [Candidatus Sulfotelmatobacter sp.]|nr:hypothetical protein [Candidatus Sulfotelmatobacter sp.]